MDTLTKFEPVFIILSIIIGYCCSYNGIISQVFSGTEEYLLMLLLFFIFLEIDFKEVRKAFKNKKFIFTALFLNFVWTPLLTLLLGKIFLSTNQHLQMALVLLLVMPCTDWFLVFTDITGGNIALSSAVLPVNLILQLILLPVYLYFFFGVGSFSIDIASAVEMIIEIVIPIALAVIMKLTVLDKKGSSWFKEMLEKVSEKGEFIMVLIIAFAIFASEGQEFMKAPQIYPMFLAALMCFYIINFILSYYIGRKLKFSWKDIISLVFISTARNTPLSLSLAGIIFPAFPIISLVLLVGPLTELPVSALESFILKRIEAYHKRKCKSQIKEST